MHKRLCVRVFGSLATVRPIRRHSLGPWMERWLPSLQGPPLQYIIILLCLSVNASWPPETPGPPRFPRRPSAEADEPGPTVNARLGKKARRRNIRFLPSTCQAWVNVISRLYQRNFFYSQQTMAAFGYQKYIFYLYIYVFKCQSTVTW